MNYADIEYEVEESVGIVTLNRPHALNAWTPRLGAELRTALRAAEDDPSVVGIVITGAGRGFCAGADVAEIGRAEADPDGADDPALDPCLYFRSIPKPVVAAINGPAAGMGLAIALACDIRFASTSAVLTTSFAHRGLAAEFGVSWLLPRLVGPSVALDLLFTARKVDAQEAERLGLVNAVVTGDGLMSRAVDFVRQLARDSSPRSMGVMKAQVYRDLESGLESAVARAAQLTAASHGHPDFAEGIRSYVERRPAQFQRIGSRAEE